MHVKSTQSALRRYDVRQLAALQDRGLVRLFGEDLLLGGFGDPQAHTSLLSPPLWAVGIQRGEEGRIDDGSRCLSHGFHVAAAVGFSLWLMLRRSLFSEGLDFNTHRNRGILTPRDPQSCRIRWDNTGRKEKECTYHNIKRERAKSKNTTKFVYAAKRSKIDYSVSVLRTGSAKESEQGHVRISKDHACAAEMV